MDCQLHWYANDVFFVALKLWLLLLYFAWFVPTNNLHLPKW